jgi:CRISPR-associated protein Csh2
MSIRSSELLFVKSVKDGIPNRDPLNDSDARRLFPEEDGRISLSDVSIKRDVRDYVLASEVNGGPEGRNHIFVQQVMNEKGKLLGRKGLAESIAAAVNKEKEAKADMKSVLLEHSFDVRTFGIVYSVNPTFHLTGPVQFGWAHSLHPVDTHYVQGTVVMPSSESGGSSDAGDDNSGKTQGTIWTTYTVPFAVFAMPGVINARNAEHTGMTEADQELLLRALWQGTQLRQARGRGQQQPLLLVHVEYHDPFFRIGYLEDHVSLLPDEQTWKDRGRRPSSIKDITLDLTGLLEILERYQDKIARCRIWTQPSLHIEGNIAPYAQPLW